MANEIIRDFCQESGVYLWQIADMVGLSGHYFCVYMRRDFPQTVQLNIVECMKKKINGDEYDLSAWNEWRQRQRVLAQAKRNDHIRKSSIDIYEWRKRNAALDEAEKRKIEGGWDTWQ